MTRDEARRIAANIAKLPKLSGCVAMVKRIAKIVAQTEYVLPANFSREIGRIMEHWAYFEQVIRHIAWDMSGVDLSQKISQWWALRLKMVAPRVGSIIHQFRQIFLHERIILLDYRPLSRGSNNYTAKATTSKSRIGPLHNACCGPKRNCPFITEPFELKFDSGLRKNTRLNRDLSCPKCPL
jgi:hypothetical protein